MNVMNNFNSKKKKLTNVYCDPTTGQEKPTTNQSSSCTGYRHQCAIRQRNWSDARGKTPLTPSSTPSLILTLNTSSEIRKESFNWNRQRPSLIFPEKLQTLQLHWRISLFWLYRLPETRTLFRLTLSLRDRPTTGFDILPYQNHCHSSCVSFLVNSECFS